MHYYLDLKMLPEHDMTLFQVWSHVFMQVHLALVEQKDTHDQVAIGVSFPDYVCNLSYVRLGSKLRLFAKTEAELQQLNLSKWLDGLSDYVHIYRCHPVPIEHIKGYVIVRRYHPKASAHRLTTRYARRKKIDDLAVAKNQQIEEYALRYGIDKAEALRQFNTIANTNFPYIHMKSLSSGHSLCVCIEQQNVSKVQQGMFSTYGLSTGATVPYW